MSRLSPRSRANTKALLTAASFVAGLTCYVTVGSGATYTFTNAADVALSQPANAEWNNPGNWDPNGVPGATDDVLLDPVVFTSANRPLIRGPGFAVHDVTANGKFIRLEDYSNSGSVTLAMNAYHDAGAGSGSADFYIRAGIATVNYMQIRFTDIGQAGTMSGGVGELRLNDGGSIVTSGEFIIGRLDNSFGNGKGIFKMPATGTVDTYALYVGAAGGDGTLLQAGGTISSFYPVHCATELLSTGYYEMNGGTLVSGTQQPNAYMFIGRSGSSGRFVQNAGFVDTGDLYLASDGSGTATYEMHGGTLKASGVFMGTSGSPTGTFMWSAGKIENRTDLDINFASFSSTFDIQLLTAGTHEINVQTGKNANVNASAFFSGPGKLTKTGGGNLNLLGACTHSGGTDINEGQVYVLLGGSIGTGDVNNLASFNVYTPATIAGVSGTGNTTIGDGTIAANVTANYVRQNSLTIATGASLAIASGGGTSKVGALSIAGTPTVPTAKLDLASTSLIVDYTGSSVLADVQSQIIAGRNGGDWGGQGITSSNAAGNSSTNAVGYAEAGDLGVSSFGGQSVDGTAVLVRSTRLGDANLDGTTNIGDFSLLAANFNQAGGWSKGDFNYDGTANIGDFSLLAANFNQAAAGDGARGVVPEPTLAGAVGLLLAARRRRS